MNVLQQIEAQAELYRVKLGLRTWEDQRSWALRAWDCRFQQGSNRTGDGPERQSGRTMRDILLALAACTVFGIRDVKIDAYEKTQGPTLAIRFEEAIHKLQLDIALHQRTSKFKGPYVTYTDHHEGR